MTVWKRMLVIVVLACLVMACIPASASAVDPVMTTAMANAFAQAVAAYGASQGVSITFDVANTDGIGEGIHELWNEFKTQTQDQDVDTFDSYAVTLFYNLFKKSSGGGNNNNNDDDKVAIAISAATVAALDKFWNWLLSGPAEMERVDNQYYEWTLNQDNTVSPILIDSNTIVELNGMELYSVPYHWQAAQNWYYDVTSSTSDTYGFTYKNTSSNSIFLCLLSDTSSFIATITYTYNSGGTWGSPSSRNSYLNSGFNYTEFEVGNSNFDTPLYTGRGSPSLTSIFGQDVTDSDILVESQDLSVRPYVYDPVVQPITIPDPDDPDYDPQDLILPLNVPWDVTMFGDGTDPMDDSQAEAAADAIGDSIMTSPDRAIELNPSSDAPVTPPSEVYIPFLPVQLPSFNFSLSGIWHYVIDWVASLGAWFTTVFTIWSNLPYAIVLPVYASAVIVIVLGVYKRFFM